MMMMMMISTAIFYCTRSRTHINIPVQRRQRIRDVVVRSQMVVESCRRVEHRLQTAYQVGWDADQYCIAVVESRVYQSHYEHLECGCRHRLADLAQLTESSKHRDTVRLTCTRIDKSASV